MSIFDIDLVHPDLKIVQEYNDKYDKTPINEVFYQASRKDYNAIYEIASRYRVGADGLDKDQKKAIGFYKEVLKYVNHISAFYHIGYLLLDGVCGNDKLTEGIPYLLAAYKLGDPDAALQLGIQYQYGEVINTDLDKALEYFYFALYHGREDAWYFIGEFYYSQKDFIKAKDCFEKAVLIDNVAEDSALRLGYMFEFGVKKIDIDLQKALKYYQIAYNKRDKNNPESKAAFMLACFLFYEKSGKKEDIRAFNLFKEDSNKGFVRSNLFLGYYYGMGILNYIEPNSELAFLYLSNVLEYQKATSLYYQGLIFYSLLHEKETAKLYLSNAASLGETHAQILLERIKKKDNPFVPILLEAAKMLGQCRLSEELKQQADKEVNANTVIKYTEAVLSEGKLGIAYTMIVGAYRINSDDLSIINELVKIIDIYLYGRYLTNKINETDKENCLLILKHINTLRRCSFADSESLSIIESNMYFNIGYYYQDKDSQQALEYFSKANVDLTPLTAIEVFSTHSLHWEQYMNEIYIDVERLKRSLKSTRWHENKRKALAYYALEVIYVNGAPKVPKDYSIAYKYIEQACYLDPDNRVFADEIRRFKRKFWGGISYDPRQ